MNKTITQEQRLDYLVEEFKTDSDDYKDLQVPEDTEGKKRILRSLMNIRMPRALSDDVLAVQDEYLTSRAEEKGIVYLSDIDNCIHTFAGVQRRAECNRQMNQLRIKNGPDYEQPTAVPMLTDAYNLPANKVIHIVGPIVQYRLTPDLEKDLADCYRNTLDMCRENGLKSVAFCCISTGVFHFPNKRAAEIAVDTVEKWMVDNPGTMERVIFNVFKDEDKKYYEELIQ